MTGVIVFPLIVCFIAFLLFSHFHMIDSVKTAVLYYLLVFLSSTLFMLIYYRKILMLRVKGKSDLAAKLFSWWRFISPPSQYWPMHFEMILEADNLELAEKNILSTERNGLLARWMMLHMRYALSRKKGEYSEAEQYIRDVLVANPPQKMRPIIISDLAVLIIENMPERTEDSIKLLKIAIADRNTPEDHRRLMEALIGCAKVASESFSEGKEILEREIPRLIEIFHNKPFFAIKLARYYHYLGLAYSSLGERDKAKKVFTIGLNLTKVKEISDQLKNDLLLLELDEDETDIIKKYKDSESQDDAEDQSF